MKKITAVAMAAIAILSSTTFANEAKPAEKQVKMQATCPVMNSPINKNLYADVEGKRVYVCCKGCIEPIRKEPAKYLKVLEDKGETPYKLQTMCPVMNSPINKELYADVKGKRVYVCCKGCVNTIEGDPDKYIQALEKAGVALDKSE